MALTPYVFDATADNFRTLVLENSAKGPVLVNYWSPRAGPCFVLMPRLVRLAAEFGGRFLLVMLNTDALGALARSHGVTSIPTVQVFRRGEVVDTLHGAESQTTLRAFIQKHVLSADAARYRATLQAYHDGDIERALRTAAEAALTDPHDTRLPLAIAKLLVLQQRYAQADDLLQALPEPMQAHADVQRLTAHVALLRAAHEVPDEEALAATRAAQPEDLDTRWRYAAVRLLHDDYDTSLQELLAILRRDRDFRGGLAARALLAVCEVLGETDERVVRCRQALDALAR